MRLNFQRATTFFREYGGSIAVNHFAGARFLVSLYWGTRALYINVGYRK